MIALLNNKFVIGGVIVIAVIFAVLFYGKTRYDEGYYNRDLSAQIEMQKLKADLLEAKDKELNRQLAANNQAQEFQKNKIAELESKNQNLEAKIAENENEANNDQNRDRIGLDPSSVLRLNKIR